MPSDIDKAIYITKAQAAARKYGISEQQFIRLIQAESDWNPKAVNPTSGAAGLGQFLPSTAREFGTSVEELLRSPDLQLDLAAKKVKGLVDMFGGDYPKAMASYFVGEGTISKASQGGGNWITKADAIAQQNGWGSVTEYLNKVGANPGPGVVGAPSGDRPSNAPSAPPSRPDPRQFYELNPDTGEWDFDYEGYLAADAAAKTYGRPDRSDLQAYLNGLIEDIGNQIETGKFNLDAATREYTRRMDAFEKGGALFTDLVKQSLPLGTEYIPGREPGNRMGLAVRRTNPVMVDPFKMAVDIVNQTPDLSKMTVGNIPSIVDILKRAGINPPGVATSSDRDIANKFLPQGSLQIY